MLRNVAVGLGIAASSLLSGTASAAIISLAVASGGIDHERTCTSTSCSAVVWTMPGGSYPTGTLFPATGSVTLDTVGLTLSIALSVASASIDGAADSGVTALTLTGTTYTSGPLPITVSGPVAGLTSYSIAAGQTAVVDPALLAEVGGGSSDPIFSAVRVTGQCGLLAGNTGSCGFNFGRVGFLMPAPLGRSLEQTFNVGVVPEPGTALLVSVSLACLAAGRRRRAHEKPAKSRTCRARRVLATRHGNCEWIPPEGGAGPRAQWARTTCVTKDTLAATYLWI